MKNNNTGLVIELAPGVHHQFYGALVGTIGDNPAQEYIGGWKESSAAFRYCRICFTTRHEAAQRVIFPFNFLIVGRE